MTRTAPYILAVEDEPALLETVIEDLEEAGYQITGVGSAEEAWDSIHARRPDLVLCDIQLPGEDGRSLMVRVRESSDDLATIPFIFLTAYDTHEDIIRGHRLGAEGYITKPVQFDQLRAKIGAQFDQLRRLEKHITQRLEEAEKRATLLAQSRSALAETAEQRLRPHAMTLLGYAEALVSETVAPVSNESQRRYLEAIHAAARTIVERLPEVGVLSNAGAIQDAGTGGDSSVNLGTILHDRLKNSTGALRTALIDTHGIERAAPAVPGDRAQLARAVDHLIGAVALLVDREAEITATLTGQDQAVRLSLTARPVDPVAARQAADLLRQDTPMDTVLNATPAAVALFAADAQFGLQGADMAAQVDGEDGAARLSIAVVLPGPQG